MMDRSNSRISIRLVLAVIAAIFSGAVLIAYIYQSYLTTRLDTTIITNIGLSNISISNSCLTTPRQEYIRHACANSHIANSVHLDYLITDDHHRVLYCFIPKVGCTSFKSMMVANIGIQVSRAWFNVKYLNSIGLKQLSQYSAEDISMRIKNYFKFMVVRHPFDRLVSAYQQKFGGHRNSHNFSPKYKNVIKDHFGDITKVDSQGNVLLSWPQFLELVATEPERFYNEHWAKYEHLCNPCMTNYSHVVYMETMSDDLDIVLDHLSDPDGPRPALPTRNVMRRTKDNTETLYKQFINIDKSVLQRLLRIYGRDLELFGYTWNSESGAGYPNNAC